MLGFCRSSPNNGSAIVCEYIGRGSLYDQLHKVMGRSVVLLILYVDYYFVVILLLRTNTVPCPGQRESVYSRTL